MNEIPPHTPAECETLLSRDAGRAVSDKEVRRSIAPAEPKSAREVVIELRRVSGLTWAQLATLLNLSRQSVHSWASGKPLASEREMHLHRVADVVTAAKLETPDRTRTALITAHDGRSAFDMLATGDYDGARELLAQSSPPSSQAGPSQVPDVTYDTRARLSARTMLFGRDIDNEAEWG